VATPDADVAQRARVAVSALFLVNGALMANVVPRMPGIKEGLDLSNAALGTALAAMPVGGLLAGATAGWLIHAFGSGRVTTLTGVAFGVALGAVGVAPSWLTLAAVFLVLGALDAVMDAAMNAHGLAVQRSYRRSILHAFHGLWSAGTMVGAASGALAAALGVPIAVHLAIVGAVLAVVCLVASRLLLRGPGVDLAGDETEAGGPARFGGLVRLLLPIAVVGVLGVMLEDAAQTWNTIYLAEVLGASAGIAAAGFLVYTGTMTVGRLLNDRWIDRWGNVAVARAGGAAAATGLGVVALAGVASSVPMAVAGFALVGLGAAPLFPVMVAAASAQPGIATGHAVGTVSWLARGGFVVAPTLVGAAADVWGLGAAFGIPLLAGVLVAAFAPTLLRRVR
jgi:MFS family permease